MELGANGGKALAYYLAAIRCNPGWYEKGTVNRVLHDGSYLFRSDHPIGVVDHTPRDVDAFLCNFREFREFANNGNGPIFYPDTSDWAECLAFAEAAGENGALAASFPKCDAK